MYHVGICDDEYNICAELENYIEKYFKAHFLKGIIDVFFDGKAMSDYLRQNNTINLLFLDIELPENNGIEIGRLLREELENESTEIIYVSSKTNYAMELFQCRPLDFLVKPINYAMVEKIMDIVLKRDFIRQKKVSFQIGKENQTFFVKDILYFRSDNKTIYMEMTSGEVYNFRAKLDDIETKISEDLFLRIHKSYLINHAYVQCYGADWIQMINGHRISISKSYRISVRQRLMQIELG